MSKKQHTTHYVMLKSRSWQANFVGAIDLFAQRFKTFLLSLLPPSLFIGLVVSIFFVLFRQTFSAWAYVELAVAAVLVVLGIAVMREAVGMVMAPYTDGGETERVRWRTSWRTLLFDALPAFYRLTVQATLLAALLYAAVRLMDVSVLMLLPVCVLLFVVIVPLNAGLNRLQFGREGVVCSLLGAWKSSWRFFGSSWSLLVTSIVVYALVAAVCFLPVFILNLAISASNAAVRFGDPSDLPTSILAVHFVLSFVLLSLAAFATVVWILPQYFQYYSVKAHLTRTTRTPRL